MVDGFAIIKNLGLVVGRKVLADLFLKCGRRLIEWSDGDESWYL